MNLRELIGQVVTELVGRLGVRALSQDGQPVLLDSDRDVFRVRIALPMRWVEVDIEPEYVFSDLGYLLKRIDEAKRTLFRGIVGHIAEHDREPLDRLKQIEAAARSLLDAMGEPGFSSGRAGDAWHTLNHLLRAKPGAASWARHGYGKDPT